jgi:hypothetical protein
MFESIEVPGRSILGNLIVHHLSRAELVKVQQSSPRGPNFAAIFCMQRADRGNVGINDTLADRVGIAGGLA